MAGDTSRNAYLSLSPRNSTISSAANQTKGEIFMEGRTMSEENWEIAATIDERVRQLTREAVNDTVLVNRMLGYIPALHRLWTSAPDEELIALSVAYPGFMRYARLMEDMSEALRTGIGVPPGVTDLPLTEEPVKGVLEGILATGATLEQQLQCRKEEHLTDKDVLLETLYRRWRSAVPQLVAHLKSSSLHPRSRGMIVQLLEEMTDRIDSLHEGAGLA